MQRPKRWPAIDVAGPLFRPYRVLNVNDARPLGRTTRTTPRAFRARAAPSGLLSPSETQELGFFVAAAFLNSVAQLAEILFISRLALMQSFISVLFVFPHSFLASFLQSCDTELLEEAEVAGAEAGGDVAVCALTAQETPKARGSNRLFMFITYQIEGLGVP